MDEQIYTEMYEMEERHWWFRGRRAVLWALVECTGTRQAREVLDAGCGTGRNLVEFGALGNSAGVDPSPEAVDFCRRRGLANVEEAGLESLPFEDDRFDLIFACDVLEHIERDDLALSELLRVSAPDARLVITVPAYGWLWSQHDDSHHHKRRYTLPRLRERAIGCGWQPRLATYFNSVLLPPIAAVRAVQRFRPAPRRTDYELTPAPLNALLEMPMRAEARLIAGGRRLPAGLSVGAVCRAE